jgi:hypothetical protein
MAVRLISKQTVGSMFGLLCCCADCGSSFGGFGEWLSAIFAQAPCAECSGRSC